MTTTSSTPSATVNDRVPSIKGADDDHVPTGSAEHPSSSSSSNTNQITASYTISAPPTPSARTSVKLLDTSDDDKLTASFTIPSPTSPTSSSSIIASPIRATAIASSPVAEKPISQPSNEPKDISESSISATVNVPSSSNNKTDLESLTKTAAPTIAAAEKSDTDPNVDTKPVASERKRSTDSASVEFTLSKTGAKDKRSLFDIDNASSLSLADKLRNEANKYSAEQSEAVTTATVVAETTGLTKLNMDRDSAERSSRSNDSAPSSPLHHATAERRPSWRLKFDAGCKVRQICSTFSRTFRNRTHCFFTILLFSRCHIIYSYDRLGIKTLTSHNYTYTVPMLSIALY